MSKQCVGIDVSKTQLDVSVFDTGLAISFANSDHGHQKLIAMLQDLHSPVVVLEPSGGYERALHRALDDVGIFVALVNPRRARCFAQAIGLMAKTDRLDADNLAEYGEKISPAIHPLCSRDDQERKELCVRRQQLKDMLVQEKNRLELASGGCRKSIQRHIDCLQEELQTIEALWDEKIEADGQLSHRRALLETVPGIGPVVSGVVVTLLPELGHLSPKEIAALVGVAPFNKDSGRMEGHRSIRGGRKRVRDALYMAAVTGARFNPVIKEFYERLENRGKPGKVIIVACMRKLLVRLNAMLRDNAPWNPKAA